LAPAQRGRKFIVIFKTRIGLVLSALALLTQKQKKSPVEDVPLLGRVEDLAHLVATGDVEEIVIALPPHEHDLMRKIVNNGVRQHVQVASSRMRILILIAAT
jgi:FlaA1/EpsC-like NDP-sugar epimerase